MITLKKEIPADRNNATDEEQVNDDLQRAQNMKNHGTDEPHQTERSEVRGAISSSDPHDSPDPKVFASLRGKYHDVLSSSAEFISRKQAEKRLEI